MSHKEILQQVRELLERHLTHIEIARRLHLTLAIVEEIVSKK